MNRLPFITLLILLLSAACGHDSRLDTAAALMYPAPDSAMALLGWTREALIWSSFASAMVFVVFCFMVLKNVSFAEAIGAIQPPALVVEAPAGNIEYEVVAIQR